MKASQAFDPGPSPGYCIKMLTIKRIVKCYENGVDVKFRRSTQNNGRSIKGLWCPDLLEVRVFLKSAEGPSDLDITLVHEFIHAVEEFSDSAAREISHSNHQRYYDSWAQRLIRTRPYILEFIKQLYEIDYNKMGLPGLEPGTSTE